MGYLDKKTVDDLNVAGKKVLVRCDFNVPLKNGVITDENRIVAALPTIKKLIADGGKVVLCWMRLSSGYASVLPRFRGSPALERPSPPALPPACGGILQ